VRSRSPSPNRSWLVGRHLRSSIGANVKSVKDLSVDEIVEAVARGLRLIDPSREYSTRLPKEMSARYRICTNLAASCQQYGYRGELGYHQFLYPSEADTRKLLMWLIEALPKAEKKDEQEALGSADLLQRAAVSEVGERLKQPWLPEALLPGGLYKGATSVRGGQRGRTETACARANHALPLRLPRRRPVVALPQHARVPGAAHGQPGHPPRHERPEHHRAQGCATGRGLPPRAC